MTVYLPYITGGHPTPHDMLRYLMGDPATLFELTLTDRDGNEHTSRCQTQPGSGVGMHHWYFTKSNGQQAEYEEMFADQEYIYRGVDTSMGDGLYYRLYGRTDLGDYSDSLEPWCPRFWAPGDIFERHPYVDVRRKSDCGHVPERSGYQQTWLRFAEAFPELWTPAGVIRDVIVLEWITQLEDGDRPEVVAERYWYARGLGLVAWAGEQGSSVVVEIHEAGTRPDNVRETIPCLTL
jgi:hypothetical protein